MSEALIFLAMGAIFVFLAMVQKLPIGISLILSALAGAILGGEGLALSHREWGDFALVKAVLFETANVSQGRLKGKPSASLITEGRGSSSLCFPRRGSGKNFHD